MGEHKIISINTEKLNKIITQLCLDEECSDRSCDGCIFDLVSFLDILKLGEEEKVGELKDG